MFVLIYVVFNIGYLIFYVKLIFVATLVQCFWFLSNIFWVLHVVFEGLSNIFGLCVVFWGFV